MARIASERLFLNADKSEVVLADDPDAKILLASAGSEIPPEYADLDVPAKFLGKPHEAPVEDEPVEKEADPAPNKAVKKPANK